MANTQPAEKVVYRPYSERRYGGEYLHIGIPVRLSEDGIGSHIVTIDELGPACKVEPNGSHTLKRFFENGTQHFKPPQLKRGPYKTVNEYFEYFIKQASPLVAMSARDFFFLILACLAMLFGAAIGSRAYIRFFAPTDFGKSVLGRFLYMLFSGFERKDHAPSQLNPAFTRNLIFLLDNLDSMNGADRDKVFGKLLRNSLAGEEDGADNRNIVIVNATNIPDLEDLMENRFIAFSLDEKYANPEFNSDQVCAVATRERDLFWSWAIILAEQVISRQGFSSKKAQIAALLAKKYPQLKKIADHIAVIVMLLGEVDDAFRAVVGVGGAEAYLQWLTELIDDKKERLLSTGDPFRMALDTMFAMVDKPEVLKWDAGLKYNAKTNSLSGPVKTAWLDRALKKFAPPGFSVKSPKDLKVMLQNSRFALEQAGYFIERHKDGGIFKAPGNRPLLDIRHTQEQA